MIRGFYFFFLLLIHLLFSGCSREDISISNLNGNKILLLGHAGSGLYHFNSLHDNSFEAVEKAVQGYGIDGVEVDIQLSSDSVLFLFHDRLLEGRTICNGCIAESNSDYLQECIYKRNFSVTLFRESYLTRLEKVFQTFLSVKDHTTIFLNIKSPDNCFGHYGNEATYLEALVKRVVVLINQYGYKQKVLIEVDTEELVQLFKQSFPEARLYWTAHNPDEDIIKARELGVEGIIVSNYKITEEDVKNAHDNKLWVCLFGMKKESEVEDAVAKNPEILIADNLDAAIEVLTRNR